MGKTCVVGGCSNTTGNHEALREKWDRFVRCTREIKLTIFVHNVNMYLHGILFVTGDWDKI